MSSIANFTDFNSLLKLLRFPKVENDAIFHICRLEDMFDKKNQLSTPLLRQHFFDISLFLNADFEYRYASSTKRVSNATLQIIPPRQPIKVIADADAVFKVKGYTIYFKPEFLSVVFDNANFIKEFPFFAYSNNNCLLELGAKNTENLREIFNKIICVYENRSASSFKIINGYLWALLHTVKEIWLKENTSSFVSQKSLLVSSFENEISLRLKADVRVSDIANILSISPKYLSETLKEETGLNAKQLLDRAIFEEAKSLLKNTPNSISEIAHYLHFSEPSNFSKFFKRMSASNPSDFRSIT
tara:strand:+ start:269 stop:1171 length:903 start_codon:yes stop_codon:yes gene_type:complete